MNTTAISPSPTVKPHLAIPERTGLSYREFCDEYLYPNRPVIIVDGMKQCPAMGKWTPGFFRDHYPEKVLKIGGKPFSMRELIDLVEKSREGSVAPYYRNEEVRRVFPELLPDLIPVPSYIFPNWLRGPVFPTAGREAELYIGGAGGGFPYVHYDANSTHAYLGQLYGDKEAILYSPDQSELMYAKVGTFNRNQSFLSDVDHPDLEKFPRFAEAVAHRGILKPGSLLFIPNRWWHTARMLTASITISYNTANASNWANVSDEVVHKMRCKRRWLVSGAATYMKLLGWVHRLVDTVGGK